MNLRYEACLAFSAAWREAAQGEALLSNEAITEHAMDAALHVVADRLFPLSGYGWVMDPFAGHPQDARHALTGGK